MKINLNKKIFYITLLAILGFILILYYIWFRFIRERLPYEIPFKLSVFSFLSLLFICLIYSYVIYRIYNPLNIQNSMNKFREQLLLLFKPFYYFDKLIKKNKYINKYMFKFFFKVITFFGLYKDKNNKYFYFIFFMLPKILFFISFVIDIFFFCKFYLVYKIVFIGMLPLFFSYSIYSITKYLVIITNHLNKNYFVVILSTEKDKEEYEASHNGICFSTPLNCLQYEAFEGYNVVASDYFISCQSANLTLECNLYKYTCIETWFARDTYVKKYKITKPLLWINEPESDYISKALTKIFQKLMPQAYYFKAYLDTFNDYVKTDFIYAEKYFIISYLICWLYILVVSLHTLNLRDLLDILNTIIITADPFSDISL